MAAKKPSWQTLLVVTPMVGGLVFGYSELTTTVVSHEKRLDELKIAQDANTMQVNKLDTYELMINANTKGFEYFLGRFDNFLNTQNKMNGQLIEISTRQEIILKQLELEK
jgi:hypothetical protein